MLAMFKIEIAASVTLVRIQRPLTKTNVSNGTIAKLVTLYLQMVVN
jgi:hypothetical protein